jgi:hypothetical protein
MDPVGDSIPHYANLKKNTETLKVETAYTSKTPVTLYQTPRPDIPDPTINKVHKTK